MGKVALIILLILSSAIVLTMLVGLLVGIIVGNEWSQYTWGDKEDED